MRLDIPEYGVRFNMKYEETASQIQHDTDPSQRLFRFTSTKAAKYCRNNNIQLVDGTMRSNFKTFRMKYRHSFNVGGVHRLDITRVQESHKEQLFWKMVMKPVPIFQTLSC